MPPPLYQGALDRFIAGQTDELETPCQVSIDGVQCLGWTGVLAARRGDTAVVRQEIQAIEGLRLSPRVLQRYQAYWLAAIADARRDLDTAVEQLRQAISKGYQAGGYGVWVHRDPMFAHLHGNPTFKEMLRPKDNGGRSLSRLGVVADWWQKWWQTRPDIDGSDGTTGTSVAGGRAELQEGEGLTRTHPESQGHAPCPSKVRCSTN